MSNRSRHSNVVDRGMLHLVRLVLDDDWDHVAAARRLLHVVPDPRILRRMAHRVESAIAERASEMDRRAALTLRTALHAVRDDLEPATTDGPAVRDAIDEEEAHSA